MTEAILEKPPALPEVRGSDLDVETLNAAMRTHGAIIVRELVPRGDALALDAAFRNALAAAALPKGERDPDWFKAIPDQPGAETMRNTRKWLRSVDCALLADSPAMLRTISDVYGRAGILSLVAAHLGEEPVLSSQKSTLRRTLGSKIYTDNWHQDGAFLGGGTRVVNVWLALTPCGEKAASVEIALTHQTGIVPTGGEGSLAYWTVSPKQATLASQHSVVPVCEPGDAILFDQLCLHRTSIDATYSEERRALETWFFAPSTFPWDFDSRPIRL